MDAQRSRRTRDQARKTWYAYYRQVRFARWLGFIELDTDGKQTFRDRLDPGWNSVPVNSLLFGPAAPLGEASFSGPVKRSLRTLIAVPRTRHAVMMGA